MGAWGRGFAASLLLLPLAAAAGAADGVIDLGGHLEYVADPEGRWTIEDVTQPDVARQFRRHESAGIFNAGLTTAAHWFRVELPAREPGEWFVSVDYGPMDFVDFYAPNPAGGWRETLSGELRPFSHRPIQHRHFVFQVPAAATAVYVRAQTFGILRLPVRLISQRALVEREPTDLGVLFLYYGILLVMIAYNGFLYAALRDRTYLDYVLAISSWLLVYVMLDGTGPQYFWGEHPEWANPIALWAWCCFALFNTRFFQSFLDARQTAPRFNRFCHAIVAASLAIGLLYPVIGLTPALRAIVLLAVAAHAIGVIVICTMWLRGHRSARFLLLAFLAPMLGFLISMGSGFGLLTGDHTVAFYASRVGTVFGVVLMSLALADRFNLERQERARLAKLKRFFSPQVAAAILEEGEDALLAPRRRDVTVVFTDLRGFTEFSSHTEPEDVIQVLREYHEVIGRAVAKHQGTLEHFAGDGVMIYFNAPVEMKQPELTAVRMVFELRAEFERLCAEWRRRGHALGVGIGMSCGFATVGAVGFEGRRDYAAVGTVTNLAARLCSEAKHGQVLAPQKLVAKVDGEVRAEALGEREIKGLPKPVVVYNLLPRAA